MLLKNYLRILVNHIALRAYVSALYQPTTLPIILLVFVDRRYNIFTFQQK